MNLKKNTLAIVAIASVLAGCASTLFYPDKAAASAADKVIDDIWPGIGKPATDNAETKKP